MKFFIALCFLAVAFAEPESDAQLYLHHPSIYHLDPAHATAGFVKHASGAVVPDDTLSVKAAKVQHAQAKHAEYLKKPYMYGGFGRPIAPAVSTIGYTGMPVSYAHSIAPAVTYTKPVIPAVTYTKPVETKVEQAITYTKPVEAKPVIPAVTYTKPVETKVEQATTYTKPVEQAITYTKPVIPAVTYTKPAVSTIAYTGMPMTYAHTTGLTGLTGLTGVTGLTGLTYSLPAFNRLVKREADSEADSQYYYNSAYGMPSLYNYGYPSTAYGYPSMYSHLNAYTGYTGAYSYPYSTLGAYRHIVKREADSEADSQYYYNSAYGMPSVYNYGYPSMYNTGAYTYPSAYSTAAYPSVYGHMGMTYGMYHY